MEQALTGIRITDLTIITAGACATQMLADLGAEVIKVESGTYPDPFRFWQQGPVGDADAPPDPWNYSPSFNMVNRNKRGICLDLKQPAGRETLLKLVAKSDAVTENFRQGVMDRLGIGYEALREVNPSIVMLSLGSQGSGGPESHYGSYGSTLDALSGLMGVTGYEDSYPIWSSGEVNYPDQVASIFGAGILLAALRYRAKTGKGTHIDLSQRELITTMIGEQVLEYTIDGRQPSQQGNRRPGFAPNDCYRCAGDDGWVAISIASDDEWQCFAAAIDQPALIADERFMTAQARNDHAQELRAVIEEWAGVRDKQAAMDCLQQAGFRAGAVRTGAELLGDPQLNARGYFVPIENTRAGHQTLRLAPYHLSRTPPRVAHPAPTLGQDTDDVLRDLLGLSATEIEQLAHDGVTANRPQGRRTR